MLFILGFVSQQMILYSVILIGNSPKLVEGTQVENLIHDWSSVQKILVHLDVLFYRYQSMYDYILSESVPSIIW